MTKPASDNLRKSIPKKVRFNVFKRDGFICQYCGAAPPKAVLEIDHIEPVSRGGDNDPDNLITACFDCNRGKGSELLSTTPESIESKALLIKEKEDQLKGYRRAVASRKRRQSKDIRKIEAVFQEIYNNRAFTDSFKQSIRINFLPLLDVDDLCDYMRKSCWKAKSSDGALKYFCGVCWSVIRGD